MIHPRAALERLRHRSFSATQTIPEPWAASTFVLAAFFCLRACRRLAALPVQDAGKAFAAFGDDSQEAVMRASFFTLLTLMAWSASADESMSTSVAVGSLGRSGINASAQYILRSTVSEQLRSRGIPTEDLNSAAYIYLALVSVEPVQDKCRYRISVKLVPSDRLVATSTDRAIVDRKPLWAREVEGAAGSCDEVNAGMTQRLDSLAAEFARDSAAGKVRANAER